MITVQQLVKQYGALTVLKGINVNIPAHEVFSITGPSGAGKSTLLHLIGTLDKPTSGHVLIDGVNPFTLKSNQLAHFRNGNIGFVFQFHHLLPEFNAVENIALPALIAGKSKKEAQRRAHELLEFMKLSDRATHKPAELSGGEQQRISVARALVNNPKLVLADEPSGNLDADNAKKLHQLFFDLRDEFQQTFVIVTHNEELARLSDNRIVLVDGLLKDDNIK